MIVEFVKKPNHSDAIAAAYGALFLRLVLTWFFAAHLYIKFFVPSMGGFWAWWHALTDRYPPFVPIYVMTVEFSCLILLPLGIRTRWVALYAMPSFLAIIGFWFRIGGYYFIKPGAEFPIMWTCCLVLQIILGDGAHSTKIRFPKHPYPFCGVDR